MQFQNLTGMLTVHRDTMVYKFKDHGDTDTYRVQTTVYDKMSSYLHIFFNEYFSFVNLENLLIWS